MYSCFKTCKRAPLLERETEREREREREIFMILNRSIDFH